LKLLIITPSFYPATYYGGPIYSTYNIAKALKRQGITVKVISTNSNGNKKLEVITGTFQYLENDLPVKYYHSIDAKGTSLSMFFCLKKDIDSADILYLVSIFSPTTPLVICLSKFLKKKLIISPRGQLGKWCLAQGNTLKKLWLDVLIKPNLKYMRWHLTSKEEELDVKSLFPEAKTFIIPNGVNLNDYSSGDFGKDRSFYNRFSKIDCSKKKIIISMGRIHKKKGFDILIEAFNKILKTGLDAQLYIAGEDFGESLQLETTIRNYCISDKAFLIGHIEGKDKYDFFKNADVFALPSHDENFGIVYAEALSAGTPILASKNTPWSDVEKYHCGKWVNNTSDDFSSSILELLNSDVIQMGKNGKEYIAQNFGWDRIAIDFINEISNYTREK
jgi:glycosyltransferase involved in cell wall biosynthesis